MFFRDINFREMANALQKQAVIMRRAGTETLADALTIRAQAFEHIAIPVEVSPRLPTRPFRG